MKRMQPRTLAEMFAAAVERHGDQTTVAKLCGVKQGTVSQYVAGKIRTVKSENLLRIAKCLGVSASRLMKACTLAPSLCGNDRLSTQTQKGRKS